MAADAKEVREVLLRGCKASGSAEVGVQRADLATALGIASKKFIEEHGSGNSRRNVRVSRSALIEALESGSPAPAPAG